jgi:hypothetical protein
MTDLIAHIRDVIDQHHKRDGHAGGALSCGCGATHLSDHSSHVAQAIVNRLRYVSAAFDEELTVLEGAE